MQPEEQRIKMDEVTKLVEKLCSIANLLGHQYKVASHLHLVPDVGSFQVARSRGTWELVFFDLDLRKKEVKGASVAVKRKFLAVSEAFFRQYRETAQAWEDSIDDDIKKGLETLDHVSQWVA